jgi:fatty acid desaturase
LCHAKKMFIFPSKGIAVNPLIILSLKLPWYYTPITFPVYILLSLVKKMLIHDCKHHTMHCH